MNFFSTCGSTYLYIAKAGQGERGTGARGDPKIVSKAQRLTRQAHPLLGDASDVSCPRDRLRERERADSGTGVTRFRVAIDRIARHCLHRYYYRCYPGIGLITVASDGRPWMENPGRPLATRSRRRADERCTGGRVRDALSSSLRERTCL